MPKYEPKPEKPDESQVDPSVIIDHAINDIWVYIRHNQDNLDSSRCCAGIRKIVNDATAVFRDEAETLRVKLDKCQTATKAAVRLLTNRKGASQT